MSRPIAIYTYDAGGERILKHSNTSVSIYLNGKKVADTIQTDATLYPSGMLVAKLGNNGSEEEQTLAYTKHYYAGTQRVSSKIGTTENLGDFLQDWYTQGTGGPVDVVGNTFGVLENAEQGVVQVYDELGIAPPTYESTPVFIPVQSFTHAGSEKEIYWFHPDHLGSTSYITNIFGEVSQHIEYFAFGETFVEEHRSSNNSPYKFNGKELDEETGWYYYGARYYDPRISVWLSVDPLIYDGTFLAGQHNSGVLNSKNLSPFIYCYQNPVILVDPNGKQVYFNLEGEIVKNTGDSNEIRIVLTDSNKPKKIDKMISKGLVINSVMNTAAADTAYKLSEDNNNVEYVYMVDDMNGVSAMLTDNEHKSVTKSGNSLWSAYMNDEVGGKGSPLYMAHVHGNLVLKNEQSEDGSYSNTISSPLPSGLTGANKGGADIGFKKGKNSAGYNHPFLILGYDITPDSQGNIINSVKKITWYTEDNYESFNYENFKSSMQKVEKAINEYNKK